MVKLTRKSPQTRLMMTQLISSAVVTRLGARAGAARPVAVATDALRIERYDLVFDRHFQDSGYRMLS